MTREHIPGCTPAGARADGQELMFVCPEDFVPSMSPATTFGDYFQQGSPASENISVDFGQNKRVSLTVRVRSVMECEMPETEVSARAGAGGVFIHGVSDHRIN